MQVLFISSTAVITPEPAESLKLYVDALGLPLQGASDDDYVFTDRIDGSKHFGVWPLAQAAMACFGSASWPSERPVPQCSIEFEVASEAAVGEAAAELEQRGYTLLHGSRTEPWGQTVARMQSAEGVIVGLSYIPTMHEQA